MYEKKEEMIEIKAAREQMRILLEQMHNSGVKLFVDDKAVLPWEAAVKAVREDSPYMADYVIGDSGKLEQVRFDRVTSR